MTLLVAWVGVDSRSPASVYIATDSRVSWGHGGDYFDNSIKTYALTRFPAIIGYCGDSLASQMLIMQTVAVIEAFPKNTNLTLDGVTDMIIRTIKRNYKNYPVQNSTGSFSIVVCGKQLLSSAGEFECYRIDSDFTYTKKEKINFPNKSGTLVVAGSGAAEFHDNFNKVQIPENPNWSTSRNVFHAFYNTLNTSDDPTIGPIPQIVYVYRKPNTGGYHRGVIVRDTRFVAGQMIDRDIIPDDLQWFNENFEITNPHTKRRLSGAQVQPPFSG